MSRTKRVISLIMVLVVVAGLVTGIAMYTASNDNSAQSGIATVVRDPGLYDGSTRIENPNPMITVGAKEIGFDEFRNSFMYWKGILEMYMAGGDAKFWENDLEGYYSTMLLEQVENELINTYLLLNMAADRNVTLSKEELDELNTKIEEELAAHEEDLDAWLAENFYTSVEMYRAQRENAALVIKMEAELTDELFAENEEKLLDGVYTAKHILLQPEEPEQAEQDTAAETSSEADSEAVTEASSETASASEEMKDEAVYARAQNLLAQIRNSADPAATFDQLMNEHSADPGLATYPGGYTFTDGAMVEEFYEATKALKVGEISEPIKTEHGYHIIMRVELDEEYVRENLSNTNSMIPAVNTLWGEIMNAAMDAAKEKYPVAFGEYYNLVSPLNIW